MYCVTYNTILACLKNILLVLKPLLKSIIQYITCIKLHAKCVHLFKKFWEDKNADRITFLLHTEVIWQGTTKSFYGINPKMYGFTAFVEQIYMRQKNLFV